MNDSSIKLVDLVAFWGAITGTISLIVAYFTYRRDNINLKVDMKKGWLVYNSPIHDPKESQIVISVYNKGRRPVTIIKAGYVYLKMSGGVILSDSMIYGSCELTEGKSKDYLIKESDVENFSEISYFAVYDAVGNAYKRYANPFYKIFFYWFIFFTHLKKKPELKLNKK